MNPKLHAQCRARLHDLEIPRPFTIEGFCRTVACHRGRGLYLHPLPGSIGAAGPCGMWIATPGADHVWYEHGTSPLHQDHIILHELAHVICGHAFSGDDPTLRRLLPHLHPAVVTQMLGRASYTTEQEQEAETLAGMIMRQAERSRPHAAGPHSPRASGNDLSRLEESFG